MIFREVKLCLGFDLFNMVYDYFIGIYVDEVGLCIMNFCNIIVILDEFLYIWVVMVVSVLSME